MCTVEVARTGLSFGIGFYQEATEVRDGAVDLFDFLLPPGDDIFVQRIGCGKPAQLHGGGKVDREIHLDAVRTEYVCQSLYLFQIFGGKDFRRSIYIVQHRCIDSDGGIGTGISFISVGERAGQFFPVPERFAGITALNAAVEVVPMVENTEVIGRILRYFLVCFRRLSEVPHFLQADQVIGSIKQTRFAGRSNSEFSIYLSYAEAFGR